MLNIREKMIEVMRDLPLEDDWIRFENTCADQYRDIDRRSSPSGRMIANKRVFIILSYEGGHQLCWRLFVDNQWIRDMTDIKVAYNSGIHVRKQAEEEAMA